MTEIIADVMTRDPATVERPETPNLEQGPRLTSTH